MRQSGEVGAETLDGRGGGESEVAVASGGSSGGRGGRGIYHEKQHLMHCAKHTLNNLYQEDWCSYQVLTALAEELHSADRAMGAAKWYNPNPYTSVVPYLGNFDIACINRMIDTRGDNSFISHHFANIKELDLLDLSVDSIIGIVINVDRVSSLWFTQKHWFAVSRIDFGGGRKLYCNLDSFLEKYVAFNDDNEVRSFVIQCIQKQNGQAFFVSKRKESNPIPKL